MSEEAPAVEGAASSGRRRIVIVTGLSGAGKSNALQAFEDAGYYCVDNLPPRMVPAVMEATGEGAGGPDGVVAVMDTRGRRYFGEELERSLEAVEREKGWDHRILFVESDDPTLVRRYKESRRPHPAARNGDVLEAIRRERQDLSTLREMADLIVDTSGYSALDARLRFKKLAESFSGRLTLSLISFGFKHGTPMDVDTLLDVRFLPNPHYDPDLRPLTGHDALVREAVLGSEDCQKFLEKASDLISFLIPRYDAEGKTYFTLGIGCTGGRHRSVAIVEELARRLDEQDIGVDLFVRHRDVER
ncbi:MAG: RNase adapter protein RapZ [uncultured Rubrobacteraceae bacterium]|uniref:RNase adapter protein RapZ n=1 Tax=uncultured Rubrobacteraceae bacterium TaxID=349277 RepID=A0A6J4P1C9_9ACTN|nr:MAG: RNase adapter protein RapZ [uncultured Rubrobacteraceae bacterium]